LDSVLTLQAAREVVEEEGFDELLDGVRERIDEIESLHRTRELTVRLSFPVGLLSIPNCIPFLCVFFLFFSFHDANVDERQN